MNQQHFIFVFGTLKEGFPNFPTNRGSRLAGDFQTVERFPLYLIGERMSPWMIATPGQGERVQGQVFAVSDTELADMDALERTHEPDGYRRLQIAVVANDDAEQRHFITFAYLKPVEQFDAAMIKKGPLSVYALSDAQLYLPRISAGT